MYLQGTHRHDEFPFIVTNKRLREEVLQPGQVYIAESVGMLFNNSHDERMVDMSIPAPLAKLSPDQIAVIKDYEHELAKKFGNPVILIAFDS